MWYCIVVVFKYEMGDVGFDLFDGWSCGYDGYVVFDVCDMWCLFSMLGGIMIGMLFYIVE